MKSHRPMLLASFAVAVACAAPSDAPRSVAPAPAQDADASAAAAQADASEIDSTAAGERRRGELHPVALEIWNDPAFQEEFTRSFLSETEIEPTVTGPERERMQDVQELMSDDKPDEARALLEKNLNEASSAVFDFTLGNLHFRADRFEEAHAAYERALEKHPKFRRAWKLLGYTNVRLARWDEAAEAITRVLELGGGSAEDYGLLGYAYSNLGNFLSAESAYRLAVLMDPATLDWKLGLARALFEQQRYHEAVALADLLIAEDPDRADFWMLQANAYIGLGKPLDAAENFELAAELGGSTTASLNMLGDIYVNEQLFELAVERYVSALEMDPTISPDRALRAAKVLTGRAAFDETKRLLTRVEEIKGDDMSDENRKELLHLRARIAVAEGAGDEEARVLEQIVAIDPFDGDALLLLGQHAERGGDKERAIFYYERAADLEDFEADAKVRHAQLLVREGRYDEALPLLRRAQTINPRETIADYIEQVERVAGSRSS